MNLLPEIGSKVHVVDGPSVEMNGEVISHVECKWGDYAEVRLFNGEIAQMRKFNNGPGIGFHPGHSILGDVDSSQSDYWNYSNND